MATKFPDTADLFSVMRIHRGLLNLSQREPAIYEAVIQHTQDRAVYAALEELESNSDIHPTVEKDPDRFLDERGIVVPPGLHLVFSASGLDVAEAVVAAAPQKKFFVGYQDSGGLRWGYEGGADGRGVVCGR